MIILTAILLIIIGIAINIIINALIFWGVGSLIIFLFNINYAWTFLHGLVIALIYVFLKDIFGGKNE